EADDDFSEDLAAFKPLKAALEVFEADFGVDHRQKAARHLRKAVADIAHRSAEGAEDFILLLEQLHQIELDDRTGGGAAGHEPSAFFQAEQRAVEAFAADMLEHDVDALLAGDLAHASLETVGAVVDDVVGAERLGFFDL